MNSLEPVKKIIKERGWTQLQYEDKKGQVCLLGACMVAVTGRTFDSLGEVMDDPTFEAYKNQLQRRVDRVTGYQNAAIITLNDSMLTTRQTIMALLSMDDV